MKTAEIGVGTNDGDFENKAVVKHRFKVLSDTIKSKNYYWEIRDKVKELPKELNSETLKLLWNEQDEEGNALLHMAVTRDDSAFDAFIDVSKQSGFNFNIQNNNGDTALSLAIKKQNFSSSYNARDLIEAGTDLNIQDKQGNTAFHLAIANGSSTVFDALIEAKKKKSAKVNLDIKNKDGDTALSLAVKKKDFTSSYNARDLIEAGANVNLQYEGGNTALHFAVTNEDQTVFNALIDSGKIDLNAKNKKGETPLDLALKKGNTYLVYKLIEREPQLFENLLKLETDLNIRNELGFTILHYASLYNNKKIVEALIENGAGVNAQERGLGATPLHLAVQHKKPQALDSLLNAKGVNLNLQDKDGKTALHLAFEMNAKDIAKKLMKAGANIRNTEGKLPARLKEDFQIVSSFKEAIKDGDLALVQALTQYFGDKLKGKYLTQITGRTLHSYAKAKGKTEIANYLEAQEFKKQKSIKDYIMPTKRTRVVNQNCDRILDDMERGEVGQPAQNPQTPKKSLRKQIKEAFFPKKQQQVRTTSSSNGLEMMERGEVKKRKGRDDIV